MEIIVFIFYRRFQLKMSAEFFKLYGGARRLICQPTVFFSTYRPKCFEVASYVADSRSLKAASVFRTPLRSISCGPFRNYCVLGSICAPYNYRTSSLEKISDSFRTSCGITELHRSHLSVSRGYKTCNSLQQAEKEQKTSEVTEESAQPEEKLSIFKRYKKMLKEYWYVLIPVHVATSLVWFGSFYYLATCGFDIVPFLENMGVHETIIEPLRKSSLGYIAVASALYKIATPARYMVTLGGTTVAINYLTKYGLLKPVPSKAKIKSMIQNKLKQTEKQTKESS